MSLTGGCQHCGRTRCQQRYWLLTYEFDHPLTLQDFVKQFERVCARSGLQIRRFVVTESASSSLVKLVNLDIGGEPETIRAALTLQIGSKDPILPASSKKHCCEAAVSGILAQIRQMREQGILPIMRVLDGQSAPWLIDI